MSSILIIIAVIIVVYVLVDIFLDNRKQKIKATPAPNTKSEIRAGSSGEYKNNTTSDDSYYQRNYTQPIYESSFVSDSHKSYYSNDCHSSSSSD